MYNIVDGLEVGVSVTANPYRLKLDDLFQMAARINKKRGFLFVSKLLGKHIPVRPSLSLGAGALLGCLYAERELGLRNAASAEEVRLAFESEEQADLLYRKLMERKIHLDEPTLFIGFAETATALGHSVFDAFEGNVTFMHTTRERIDDLVSEIDFEEEHSHAVAHRCYVRDPGIFRGASKIVLVDDEITTGKTALNIIRELHGKFGKTDYVVASLLDWRSQADRKRFVELENELGVRIRCLALVEGSISVNGSPLEERAGAGREFGTQSSVHINRHDISSFFAHLDTEGEGYADEERSVPYLMHTGRFGMNARNGEELDRELGSAAEYLLSRRSGERILCLGTGEFMYIPMRIAELMGDGTYIQSTTRSPIHPLRKEEYAVSSAYRYDSVDGEDVANYMYNIHPGQYDEIFVFVEREYDLKNGESFERELARIGIPIVHLVFFGKQNERRVTE
ncbi:hypothetical protein FPZ45_05180 [Cohnella terricola]|uniref:Phosphoribosyltransferase n=1 Tax=Cohnella terricola TaxID=1289167 RepID=A0A559JU15_9BACL|nr:hypothetical protein FPZ45_05180 [Cohnella terricola]